MKLSFRLSSVVLCTSFVLLCSRAYGLTATPLTLKKTSGIFQVLNKTNKSYQVSVKVFPVQSINGVDTAATKPFTDEEVKKLIRFRPHGARIRSRGRRNINYTILKTNVPFYLCALNQTETLLLRVCSAWKASTE